MNELQNRLYQIFSSLASLIFKFQARFRCPFSDDVRDGVHGGDDGHDGGDGRGGGDGHGGGGGGGDDRGDGDDRDVRDDDDHDDGDRGGHDDDDVLLLLLALDLKIRAKQLLPSKRERRVRLRAS